MSEELDKDELRGMVLELNAKEVREVTYKELARRFNIPEKKASFLKSALNYVPTIIDSNLSIEDMECKTKLPRKTIYDYKSALLKIRFEKTKKSEKNVASIVSRLRKKIKLEALL